MQIKESRLGETIHSKHMDGYVDDESECETLSLSDLPLYSDDHHLQRGEYNQQDLPDNEEDFEFSSQELTSKDNIVFCGKLMAYKPPYLPQKEYTKPAIKRKDQEIKSKKHNLGLFKWKFPMRRSATNVLVSKNGDKNNTAPMQKENENQVSRSKHEKERYGFSGRKVSLLTSSSSGKAKWYLFLFGISNFPTTIELRDMKSRLHRSGQSRSRISLTHGFQFQDYEDELEEKACKEMNRRWGLFELLKTLNCGRN